MPSIRVIGPGRAGRSLAGALADAGWTVAGLLGRHDDLRDAAAGVDALVLAVPDAAVADVAGAVAPVEGCVVVHLAGSLSPDVLAPHPRRVALHPLVTLPDPDTGAGRLRSGVTFALAGDPWGGEVVAALGGTAVAVAEESRAAYHAAAAIAANHLVALLGQVQRVAAAAGLDLEVFWPLVRGALDDVARLGPRAALTGPASRGDWETIARHLEALPPEEHPGYRGGVSLALQLADAQPAPIG